MILLSPDCLLFQLPNGERVPLSAAAISVELVGEASAQLDAEVVHHAAAAVFHHFQNDLGQTTVTAGEFSAALQQALQPFGLEMISDIPVATPPRHEADLRLLAAEAGKTELLFYPRLRDELRRLLGASPERLRFRGLRGCLKQLTGSRRWNPRCRHLEEQILNYLRQCLTAEAGRDHCLLVVE